MEFQFHTFPTFNEGESFSTFRRKFFHCLAKSKLRYFPTDDWDYSNYNSLMHWLRHTLIWHSLGSTAKQSATRAKLTPYDRDYMNFEQYIRILHDFFEKKTPKSYYEQMDDILDVLHEDNTIKMLFTQD